MQPRNLTGIRWVPVDFDRKRRLTRWYKYVTTRFDLVSFARLAIWYAQRPDFSRDGAKYLRILRELEDAIFFGEFGEPDSRRPPVVYMPPPGEPRPSSSGWRFPGLRLSARKIRDLHAGEHLWMPRSLVVQWCETRKLNLPPWLLEQPKLRSGGTSGQEVKLTRWLTEQMRASPHKPRSKSAMMEEAKKAAVTIPSDRAFDRAWIDAVKAAGTPAWSGPGRRN